MFSFFSIIIKINKHDKMSTWKIFAGKTVCMQEECMAPEETKFINEFFFLKNKELLYYSFSKEKFDHQLQTCLFYMI